MDSDIHDGFITAIKHDHRDITVHMFHLASV
jgi:hypothetical protein